MVDKTGGAHCFIMIINVEYMLDDKTERVSFTDEQFLIATGCDWRTASKATAYAVFKKTDKREQQFLLSVAKVI